MTLSWSHVHSGTLPKTSALATWKFLKAAIDLKSPTVFTRKLYRKIGLMVNAMKQ
jgi:hypothetical protein